MASKFHWNIKKCELLQMQNTNLNYKHLYYFNNLNHIPNVGNS